MSAIGINGQAINIGDSLSVVGLVLSQSGTGSTALITVETAWSPATLVAQAADMQAVEHSADANHTAISFSGKNFGQPQDQVTVLIETVTSIVGNSNTARVTGTLVTSQMPVTVPAGVCASASSVGGTQ